MGISPYAARLAAVFWSRLNGSSKDLSAGSFSRLVETAGSPKQALPNLLMTSNSVHVKAATPALNHLSTCSSGVFAALTCSSFTSVSSCFRGTPASSFHEASTASSLTMILNGAMALIQISFGSSRHASTRHLTLTLGRTGRRRPVTQIA